MALEGAALGSGGFSLDLARFSPAASQQITGHLMKTILSVVMTLTGIIILCIVGWQLALYRQANSPEGLVAARHASGFIAAQRAADANRDKPD